MFHSRVARKPCFEVIAGRIDFSFIQVPLALPHVREGKLLALAVNSAQRSAVLPSVPTLAEAGFANAEHPLWYGMFVAAKTPRGIVDQIHRETLQALQTPKVRDKLATLDFEPMVMNPAEFDAVVKSEIVSNAALIKAAGIKPD
jgi:tripartite-type tricarboxylate transporter receptor subunit TctC